MNAIPNIRAAAFTDQVEGLNFKYSLVNEYRIDQLDPKKRRVQVRSDASVAPKHTVDQYARQMPYGGFPPIVVTKDGVIVDGNTRITAARKAGMHALAAIVLDVNGGHGRLPALAAALNNANGARLKPKEEIEVAVEMLTSGLTTDAIEELIGLPAARVNKAKRIRDAELRFDRVLTDVADKEQVIASFGPKMALISQPRAAALHDEPWKRFAAFVRDANLNQNECKEMLDTLEAKQSDEDQIAYLTSVREENQVRIREHKLTGDGKPAPARQIKQKLGSILKARGSEENYVEIEPAKAEEYAREIKAAIEVLTTILEAQRSYNERTASGESNNA